MFIQCQRQLNTAQLEKPTLEDKVETIIKFMEVGKSALPYGESNDFYWFRFELEYLHKFDVPIKDWFVAVQKKWEEEDPKRKRSKLVLETNINHARKVLTDLDATVVDKYFVNELALEERASKKRAGELAAHEDMMQDDGEEQEQADPDVLGTQLVIDQCRTAIEKLGTFVIGYVDDNVGEHLAKYSTHTEPLHYVDTNTVMLTKVPKAGAYFLLLVFP